MLKLPLTLHLQQALPLPDFCNKNASRARLLSAKICAPHHHVFADAFSAGVTSQGLDVIRIGLASTDMLYFAAGKLNFPGAMFTASHNPAEYNGIKLCLSGARPIGKESGLLTIERFVNEGSPIDFRSVGTESEQDLLTPYVDHLLNFGRSFRDPPTKGCD
jgi:phosphomannomutase